MTYRMIVKTDGRNDQGRAVVQTEMIRHIQGDDLDARRDAARRSAPLGSTRTIRVVQEN
jgi:hypothetical protein